MLLGYARQLLPDRLPSWPCGRQALHLGGAPRGQVCWPHSLASCAFQATSRSHLRSSRGVKKRWRATHSAVCTTRLKAASTDAARCSGVLACTQQRQGQAGRGALVKDGSQPAVGTWHTACHTCPGTGRQPGWHAPGQQLSSSRSCLQEAAGLAEAHELGVGGVKPVLGQIHFVLLPRHTGSRRGMRAHRNEALVVQATVLGARPR